VQCNHNVTGSGGESARCGSARSWTTPRARKPWHGGDL